ncbi:hypothetical protein ABH994_003423 [Bradyrhizobium yuanmingense]
MSYGARWLRFYGRSEVAEAIRNNDKLTYDKLFALYW